MALINKQKAIDEIRDFQAQVTCSYSKDWESGMNEGFDHAVGVIELMETVDAEPVRHGYWIECEGRNNEYYCSECYDIWKSDRIKGMKYCPSCGVKMDGENEQLSSDACDQISDLVIERLKTEKILEQLGQNLGEVFGKIAETIDDYRNEILKEKGKEK